MFELIHGLYQEEAKKYFPDHYEEGQDRYEEEQDTYVAEQTQETTVAATIEFTVYPSDLEALEPSETRRNELYDNLIFNGYIDEAGNFLQPHICADTSGKEGFRINADFGIHAAAIYQAIHQQIDKFDQDRLLLDPQIFAELALHEKEVADLMENLKFNQYLLPDNSFRQKGHLLALNIRAFDLSLQFYPQRRAILRAIQQQLSAFKSHYYQVSREMLGEVADEIAAQLIQKELEGRYLQAARLKEDQQSFFNNPANRNQFHLQSPFADLEAQIVFDRIRSIQNTGATYQFTLAALEELDFTPSEIAETLEILQLKGYIDEQRKIPENQLAYFLHVENALQFQLEYFEDYSKDIFFILHAVAKNTDAAITEISQKISRLAQQQEETLYLVLQDELETNPEIAELLLRKISGEPDFLVESFMLPILAVVDSHDQISREPENATFNLAYRRMRQLVLLINTLKLNKAEVEVILRDQHLIEKFPEKLHLPEGVNSFDALLEDSDGLIYLFVQNTYYLYHAATYVQITPDMEEETLLSLVGEREHFLELLRRPNTLQVLLNTDENISKVDAAFSTSAGNAWIITGKHFYYKEKGSYRWEKSEREWGKIESNFDLPEKIDAAFQDEDGKTYLFSGDQYIRYSGDYQRVDKGYPRKIEGNWKREGLNSKLPKGFQLAIDAAFQGKDQKTYLFKEGRYVCTDEPDVTLPINDLWGQVNNNFATSGSIDAAYTNGHIFYLFAGDQVIACMDSPENEELHVLEGYPRKIGTFLPQLPAKFQDSISAAFKGEDGKFHLFCGNETVSFAWGEDSIPAKKTQQTWGIVRNNFQRNGTVDAAFVGLDGKTYLFSGNQYVRYSGNEYEQIDEGYPRMIATDWGGLNQVDAAFVLNGKTYLYEKIANNHQKYVRYSTQDYTSPDEGYPLSSGR